LPELVAALRAASVFESLGLRYLIGGSLASSLHGVPRSSNDADLLAEVPGARAGEIAAGFEPDFYVDADMIRDAVRSGGPFNLIHHETAFKVDVFVLTRDPLLQEEMQRREKQVVDEGDPPAHAYFATAEDTVLQKLAWYRKGGEVSERQWNDVAGVLKVQGDRLDGGYLNRWATAIGVHDLLAKALHESGIA
jgi:hypothetical protein